MLGRKHVHIPTFAGNTHGLQSNERLENLQELIVPRHPLQIMLRRSSFEKRNAVTTRSEGVCNRVPVMLIGCGVCLIQAKVKLNLHALAR